MFRYIQEKIHTYIRHAVCVHNARDGRELGTPNRV